MNIIPGDTPTGFWKAVAELLDRPDWELGTFLLLNELDDEAPDFPLIFYNSRDIFNC